MLVLYSEISEKAHESRMQKYLDFVGSKFINKILNYRRWQDRQSFLLGRLMLAECFKIYGLSSNEINNLQYTNFGKPFLSSNAVFFNISHSGNFVVCAITDKSEVGIDIQLISTITLDDFKSQLTEKEWSKILLSDNKNEAFFDYWTQKEAVIKAHGSGLSLPLKSFDVLDNTTSINGEKYYLKEFYIAKRYKCYIAQKENIFDFSIKEFQIDN